MIFLLLLKKQIALSDIYNRDQEKYCCVLAKDNFLELLDLNRISTTLIP